MITGPDRPFFKEWIGIKSKNSACPYLLYIIGKRSIGHAGNQNRAVLWKGSKQTGPGKRSFFSLNRDKMILVNFPCLEKLQLILPAVKILGFHWKISFNVIIRY